MGFSCVCYKFNYTVISISVYVLAECNCLLSFIFMLFCKSVSWCSMAQPWWLGMSQYGIRATVANTEPGWAEQIDLSHFHGIGKSPNFC